MAKLEDLIQNISDPPLREAFARQVAAHTANKKSEMSTINSNVWI